MKLIKDIVLWNGGEDVARSGVKSSRPGQGGPKPKPVAAPDSASVEAGGTVVIDALANDTNLTSITAASADVGEVSIGGEPDYLLTYTAPASDAATTATIAYTAEGTRGSVTGSVSVAVTATAYEPLTAGNILSIETGVAGTLSFLLVQEESGGEVLEDGIVRGGTAPMAAIASGPAWISLQGDYLVLDDSGGAATDTVTLRISDPLAPDLELTLDVVLFPQLMVDSSGAETRVTVSEPAYTETLGAGEPWAAGDYTVTVSDVTGSAGPVQMLGAPAKIWNDGTQDTLQWWYLTDKPVLDETIEWFDGAGGSGTSLATGTQIAPSGWASVVLTLTAGSDAGTLAGTATVTLNEAADTTAPSLVTASPADGSTDVVADTSDLAFGFDKDITRGTGTISIYDETGAVVIETFDVETDVGVSAGEIITVGQILFVRPSSPLPAGRVVSIRIDPGAIVDLVAGNPFAGVSSAAAWSITTAADTAVQDIAADTSGLAFVSGLAATQETVTADTGGLTGA